MEVTVFPEQPDAVALGRKKYKLRRPHEDGDRRWEIGHEWNGASIPLLASLFLGYFSGGIMLGPSLPHDDDYFNGGTEDDRRRADMDFFHRCLEVGVERSAAWKMLKALQKRGWLRWGDRHPFNKLGSYRTRRPTRKHK